MGGCSSLLSSLRSLVQLRLTLVLLVMRHCRFDSCCTSAQLLATHASLNRQRQIETESQRDNECERRTRSKLADLISRLLELYSYCFNGKLGLLVRGGIACG